MARKVRLKGTALLRTSYTFNFDFPADPIPSPPHQHTENEEPERNAKLCVFQRQEAARRGGREQ
jgi:hypothetical protein